MYNWSGRRDSNPRHSGWKPEALPLSYTREKQMTVRAAQIAKIIDELVREGTPVDKVVLIAKNKFPNDKITDLEHAITIVVEIQRADLAYIRHCFEQENGA